MIKNDQSIGQSFSHKAISRTIFIFDWLDGFPKKLFEKQNLNFFFLVKKKF